MYPLNSGAYSLSLLEQTYFKAIYMPAEAKLHCPDSSVTPSIFDSKNFDCESRCVIFFVEYLLFSFSQHAE